jgi:DNA invertase Pin-like site-specific DNA recombinase
MDFDLSNPMGKLLFDVLGSFAEFERSIINERTKEGYQAAKAKGVICNRPKIQINKTKALDLVFNKGLSASAAGAVLGVTPGTMKTRLNEWGYVYISPEWVLRGDK